MSERRPRTGNLLELWKKLKRNKGYSSENIYKIARDGDLGEHTAKNMLSHGIKRAYLFWDEDSHLYYRSDSALTLNGTSSEIQETNTPNLDMNAITETLTMNGTSLEIQDTNTSNLDGQAITEIVIEDIEKLRRLKQEKEDIERKLNEVARKIAELAYLDRFIVN